MPDFLIEATKNCTPNPDTSMFEMHTHEFYEIFCFLTGKAKYFIEGTVYDLKPNDILIINKSEAHSLLIKSNAPYKRFVIHFNAEALLGDNKEELLEIFDNKPLGKNNHYPSSLFDTKKIIYYLEKGCETDSIDDKRLYITMFLRELSFFDNKIPQNDKHYQENLSEILQYINRELTNDISLEKISRTFNFSKTHLNRKFKEIVGSTVWDYILIKRLLLAKELLKSGTPPTLVYINCGFNDYCSFYRNYKKRFGVSPKNDFVSKK